MTAACTHKVASDFIVEQSSVAGRRLWRCSCCGLVGSWEDDWMYYGNVECRRCQATSIDAVYCGPCATKVDQSKPPRRIGRKARGGAQKRSDP